MTKLEIGIDFFPLQVVILNFRLQEFRALLFDCVYNIPLSLSLATLLGEGGSSLGSGLEFLVRVGTFAEPINRIRR